MKKLILLLLLFSSNLLISENNRLSGFFNYVKLSEGQKKALNHYIENYEDIGPFIIIINQNDMNSFSLVGHAFSIESFLLAPSYYYSLYKSQIVSIYDGTEKNYYPSPSDFLLIFDFLSNFIDGSMFVDFNWEEYKLTKEKASKSFNTRPPIYDPTVITYKMENDSIIYLKESGKGYPDIRFWNWTFETIP